jgi:hypothetical protein
MKHILSKKAIREGELIYDVNQLRGFPALFAQFQRETAAGQDPFKVYAKIYKAHPEVDIFYCIGHDIDHPFFKHLRTKTQSVNKLEASQ